MKAKIRLKAKIKEKTPIKITTEYIKLDSFLKLANLVETGGRAKELIESGQVSVNGETELRRGKKLRPGDTVSLESELFEVVAGQ